MGLTLVREDRVGRTSSVSVVAPAAAPSSYVRKGETLKASKRETPRKTRSPFRKDEGSRKTTGSIGRMCKCSNALSLPVLTANRLTALINSLPKKWLVISG